MGGGLWWEYRNIRRIIFEAVEKFDGKAVRVLSLTQLKQIAGRAGRFGTEYAVGQATTLVQEDMATLKRALAIPMIEIKVNQEGGERKSGVVPKGAVLTLFYLGFVVAIASRHPAYSTDDRRVCNVIAQRSFLLCAQDIRDDVPELIPILPITVPHHGGK